MTPDQYRREQAAREFDEPSRESRFEAAVADLAVVLGVPVSDVVHALDLTGLTVAAGEGSPA